MNGKNYKLNIPLPLRIVLLIILSNILFYLLFFPGENKEDAPLYQGLMEVKVEAKLMTSFQIGKKVTIHHQLSNQNIEARLVSPPDEEGLTTVATDEESARFLLTKNHWRIIPPLKLNVAQAKGESREIKY